MKFNDLQKNKLFGKIVNQYDKLRKMGAFLNAYKNEPIFESGFEEFDNSKETVMQLIDEYKACESPDYVNYGMGDANKNVPSQFTGAMGKTET